MFLPSLSARIARRVLLNLRVDPEYWSRSGRLPSRLEPVDVDGASIAGVCLIRLRELRPAWAPRGLGVSTEGAAFRVACRDRDRNGARCVAIIGRWTSSRLVRWTDGVTPMHHRFARFTSTETASSVEITVNDAAVGDTCHVKASATAAWPGDSVFGSVDEASAFFAQEADGHTVGDGGACLGGVSLTVPEWRVTPLAVEEVTFPWLPQDVFDVDHALLMRDAESTWRWFGA